MWHSDPARSSGLPGIGLRLLIGAGLWWGFLAGITSAGTIETDFIQQPWPRQRVRSFEVGRHPVRWRERASKQQGLFAGVQFSTPLERQAVWGLATDVQDVGRAVPGVSAVRVLEDTPTRRVVEVDVKVLWKELRLSFEVEQEPPRAIRFRLVTEALGEFRGVCVFEERSGDDTGAGTMMELSTWLSPSRPVPLRLLLFVERMALLEGVKGFLETCDRHAKVGGER